MKLLIPLFAALLLTAISATAQRKHSFALGADYTRNSYSRDWTGNPDVIRIAGNDRRRNLEKNANYWLVYYYRNTFSLRVNTAGIYQTMNSRTPIKGFNTGYDVYHVTRQNYFMDFTAGYNVLHSKSSHLAAWVYGGPGYCSHGESAPKKWYPVAQAQLKYNPIRYVFVGVGGSCRYIRSNYQQFAATASLGLQL